MNHRAQRPKWTAYITLVALTTSVVMALVAPAAAAPPNCFGKKATIVGTKGSDELTGTNRRDVIVSKGGDDMIDSRGGNDLVCAGGGFDVIFARAGNDKVAGEGSFNMIFPGAGNDFVDGGKDGGFVTYEGSDKPLNADLGKGIITGAGRDEVTRVTGVGGSEADDVLTGTKDFDDLEGFGGNDVVTGLGGDDFLNSGAGNDTVAGGGGRDTLDLVVAHAGPGLDDDTPATSGAVVDMPAGTVVGGDDVGSDTFSGIERVGATLGDDTLLGTAGNDELIAWDGEDVLSGGEGDDYFAPGPDDDVVDGHAGLDVVDYFPSRPGEAGLVGPVTVDLETQTTTGAQGNDALMSIEGAAGTLLDDTLIGSEDADILLLGDEGSDTIAGRGGDDHLEGDALFFGIEDLLPGTDSLNGGPGEDTCLDGEINEQCEVEDRPRLESRRMTTVVDARLSVSLRENRR
jgi:Ca2+-binding RTX toxin-like protein